MFFDGEKRFSSQNYFSQAKISYESKRLPIDQMNVSERHTELKKTEMRYFLRSIRKLQLHMIKRNKEITLETRETYFLYRKPQIFKKMQKKSFCSVNRIVPKKIGDRRYNELVVSLKNGLR